MVLCTFTAFSRLFEYVDILKIYEAKLGKEKTVVISLKKMFNFEEGQRLNSQIVFLSSRAETVNLDNFSIYVVHEFVWHF